MSSTSPIIPAANPDRSLHGYALLQAAEHGDVTVVAECLEHGVNPDVTDLAGRTALARACGNPTQHSAAIVQLLLGSRADPTHRCNLQRVPAHEAALAGNLSALQLLTDAHAPLDALDIDQNAPLHLASDPACVNLLLSSGVRCFAENQDGHTPLMEAVLRDDLACAAIHLRYGARPLVRNREDVSAVVIASDCGLEDMLGLLHRHCSAKGPNGELEDFDAWLDKALEGTPSGPPRANFCLECPSAAAAARGDEAPAESEGTTGAKSYLPYYAKDALDKALAAPTDDERVKHLRRMCVAGPLRVLQGVPDSVDFATIRRDFPNFERVTEFFERQVALCGLDPNRAVSIPPLLLLGDPGVGKTRYALEVSKVLGLEFAVVSCSGVSAGFVLAGSSTSWKNGKPGRIHTALRDGRTINPVIMLDELDKLSGSATFDAHGPLYQLLERRTAGSFEDECLEVPMDCSRIIWIATANELAPIPEAIASRLTVLDVPAPSGDGVLRVARSVYRDILEEHASTWGPRFDPSLPDEVLNQVSQQTPREIRKALLHACGEAATRHALTRDEGCVSLQTSDLLLPGAYRTSRKMGFQPAG